MIKAIDRTEIPVCVNVIQESFLTVANDLNLTVQNAPKFTAFAMSAEKLYFQYDHVHRPMYAYYIGDEMVGYYSLTQADNGECTLNHLCVVPKYRHKGIGKELLQNAFVQAQELQCTKMNIGIVEENQKLRKWYEAFGFEHVGTQKFDFFPFTCGYMVKNL